MIAVVPCRWHPSARVEAYDRELYPGLTRYHVGDHVDVEQASAVRDTELHEREPGNTVLLRQARGLQDAVRIRLAQHKVVFDLARNGTEQRDEQRGDVVNQRLAETLDVDASPDPRLGEFLPKFVDHARRLRGRRRRAIRARPATHG